MANEKRLIDANATEKVMNERYKALAAEYGHYDHYTTGYGDALCVVEDAPTVDAVEVVHGEWIDKLEIPSYSNKNIPVVECSKCRCLFLRHYQQSQFYLSLLPPLRCKDGRGGE